MNNAAERLQREVSAREEFESSLSSNEEKEKSK